MTSARDEILAAIRRRSPVGAPLPLLDGPLPPLDGPWTTYADPRQQFFDVLAGVGGRGHVVAGAAALRSEVDGIAQELAVTRIYSAVPAATPGTIPWESIDEPHDLADVELAVLPGQFAVAENAAVWVTESGEPHRAAYFLAQYLVLVLPASRLVHNMHEAYALLAADAPGGVPFAAAGFGTFLSGPSKTADIEQSLVIGAHGVRSLHVLLVE